MKKETIIKVLYWALGIKIVYLGVIFFAILSQKSFKEFFALPESVKNIFIVPIDIVSSAVGAVILMLILVIIINNELKTAKTSMVIEVIGMILFSGIYVIIGYLGRGLMSCSVNSEGMDAVVNYSTLVLGLNCFEILSRVSSAVFILACGMSIAYKKDLKKSIK